MHMSKHGEIEYFVAMWPFYSFIKFKFIVAYFYHSSLWLGIVQIKSDQNDVYDTQDIKMRVYIDYVAGCVVT